MPSRPQPPPPVLAPAALEELRNSLDDAGAVDVIQIYLADTPDLLRQLRQSIEAGDVATVYRAAHSLKSSSAIFGAQDLAALCREVEATARGGSLEGAVEKAAAIETHYERVKHALAEELARLNRPAPGPEA